MASTSSSIRDYFPNIKVRTMAKDLETLTAGGGVVQEPEKETAHFADFVSAQETQKKQGKRIAPPTITVPTPEQISNTHSMAQRQAEKTSLEQFLQQPLPVQQKPEPIASPTIRADEQAPMWLYAVLGVIAIAIIGSIGYWIIYPRIQEQLARMRQTPTPIPTQAVMPSPTIKDPRIETATLPANGKIFTLPLESTSTSNFFNQLETSLPSVMPSTGTVAFFSFPTQNGAYLTSQDLVTILAPKSLPSFRASLDDPYLFFAYWYTIDRPALGIVFSVKQGQDVLLKQFMRGWETSRIEQDFQNLFAPAQLITRTSDSFTDALVGQVPSRMTHVTKDGEPAQFMYAFYKNYLIFATNSKAFELIAQSLK